MKPDKLPGTEGLKLFNTTFALISVIPFLVFVYILASKFFTPEISAGDIGLIVLISMFISFCGILAGYGVLKNMITRMIYYAARARQNDQAKSELVASVSHELKNPLAILGMNLSNMKDGLFGTVNPDQSRALELAQEITERMTHLVIDILDMHKIEMGRSDIKRTLCNLTRIFEKQAKEFEVLANKKNIRLTKDAAGK